MLQAWIGFSVVLLLALALLFWKQLKLQRLLEKPSDEGTSFLMLQQNLEALREQVRNNLEGGQNLLTQQLQGLQRNLDERLRDSGTSMQKTQESVGGRLDQAAKVIGDLKEKLGKLEESNQRMVEVGKDIRSLQEILKTPKLRGSLGEFLLNDLLSQILPRENFELQYCFKNQEKVDAIVRIGGKIVSVDAKFPLENFRRILEASEESDKKNYKKLFVSDVKKHIDAIANKYICPDQETYDFALMYVPAENIYYEVMVKDDLGDHALGDHAMKRRVIPVSPNTLYVYLNTIVLGLKGLHVEKAAQEILKGLSRLEADLGRMREGLRKLGGHLRHADGAFEEVNNRFEKFEDRMQRLHGQSTGAENLLADESPAIADVVRMERSLS